MIVTLIGYRGCGKSSVGPLLAERLNCSCVDSDDEIENRTGKSIRQIFADDGEAAFRDLETVVLNELLQKDPIVIAAGGGAILADVNRHRMQIAGPVILLSASCETLAARIAGDQTSATRRPSLTGKSIQEEVAEVMAFRAPLYRGVATQILDTDANSPAQIAEDIFCQISGGDQ